MLWYWLAFFFFFSIFTYSTFFFLFLYIKLLFLKLWKDNLALNGYAKNFPGDHITGPSGNKRPFSANYSIDGNLKTEYNISVTINNQKKGKLHIKLKKAAIITRIILFNIRGNGKIGIKFCYKNIYVFK